MNKFGEEIHACLDFMMALVFGEFTLQVKGVISRATDVHPGAQQVALLQT
jgi:hypothetical protein